METTQNNVKELVILTINEEIASYRKLQDRLAVGSYEWKYYQGKINTARDIRDKVIDLLNTK